MIVFNKVIGEGFGSIIKRTKYTLDSPEITIIRGKNGAGKTTIFSLLCWVLFGVPLKPKSSIVTWKESRSKNFRGTQGIAYISRDGHRYKIIRNRAYKGEVLNRKGGNELIIIKDKEEVPTSGIKDAQAYIEREILGFSLDVFRNGIVFGQKLQRFIEESGPNKKKVFDEIFETTWIEMARKSAKEKWEEINDILNIKRNSLEEAERAIHNAEATVKDWRSTLKSVKRDKEIEIQGIENGMKEQQRKIDEFPPLPPRKALEFNLDKALKKAEKLKEMENELFVLELAVERLEGEIQESSNTVSDTFRILKALKHRKCPECGSKINDEISESKRATATRLSEKAQKTRDQAREELKNVKAQIANLNSSISSKSNIKDTIDQIRSAIIKWDKDNAELNKLKQGLESYKTMLENAKKKSTKSIKQNLEKAKLHLADTQARIGSLTSEVADLDKDQETHTWLMKTLSNSGMKGFIFEQACKLINHYLDKYCRDLSFKIQIGVDLKSANKDFYATLYKNKVERLYTDLSGGEKQMVDVFVAFAINDTLNSSIKGTNLFVLDEVFESLDAENCEYVMDFIIEKSQSKSVHLITHNELIYPSGSRVITFNNKNNQTILE